MPLTPIAIDKINFGEKEEERIQIGLVTLTSKIVYVWGKKGDSLDQWKENYQDKEGH